MHAPEAYRGDTARALADTKDWLADGWHDRATSRRGTAPRDAPSRCSAARTSQPGWTRDLGELVPSVVHVSCGSLDYGFVNPAIKLAVLTETDLTGQRTTPRTWAGCRRAAGRPSTR